MGRPEKGKPKRPLKVEDQIISPLPHEKSLNQDKQKYQAYKLLFELVQNRDESLRNYKTFKGLDQDWQFPKFEVPWVTEWIRFADTQLLKRQFGSADSGYWARRPNQQYSKLKAELEEKAPFMVSPQISYF